MRLIDLFEDMMNVNSSHKLYKSRKYGKILLKLNKTHPKKVKMIKDLVSTLEKEGTLSGHNSHRISQSIKSDYTNHDEKGWIALWISRNDDIRLAYYKHSDGVIEVKVGTAKEVGYSH